MTLQEFLNKLPETDKPVVSIFSGGLDSTVMTYALVQKYGADKVYTLTYDYKQKHRVEMLCAGLTNEILKLNHKTIDISFLGEINKDFSNLADGSSIETPDGEKVIEEKQSTNYIANRNSILINIAVSYAETIGAGYVFYGAQSNDIAGFWDCTKEYVETLNNTFALNREHQIKVIAPFMGLWKTDEIKLGKELEVPFEHCWTCYNPVTVPGAGMNHSSAVRPCGKCLSCVERMQAFKELNIEDPAYANV